MPYIQEYQRKFSSAEQAVRVIKSGDWVDYTFGLSQPCGLDEALAERKDELQDIKIRAGLTTIPKKVVSVDPNRQTFIWNNWHFTAYERKLQEHGLANFIPLIFRTQPITYEKDVHVDVAMVAVSPMDEDGYFNFSLATSSLKSITEKARVVIVEENECLPAVKHGLRHKIHISEVDIITRCDRKLPEIAAAKPDLVEEKIASYIMEDIKNGSTIQLGIGGMPNAVGTAIANSDLKDLGMHTEMLVDAYLDMHKQGKLTNHFKNLDRGKNVWTFAAGSQALYDWVRDNDTMMSCSVDYVNNPHVIAQIDNFISVNNCLEVDLFGQISSETSDYRQISGTGGQLDFVSGAYLSKGGKSFICFKSTHSGKSGMVSRIVPVFSPATITTVPRSQVNYLVSEYGKVNLAGATTWERAERIISIAHPDFREELIVQAERMNIWRNSNKR